MKRLTILLIAVVALVGGGLLLRISRSSVVPNVPNVERQPGNEVLAVAPLPSTNGDAGSRIEAEAPEVLAEQQAERIREETSPLFDLWFSVFDESGAVLEEASIVLSSPQWPAPRSLAARTEDRLFHAPGVPAGVAVVEARCPGHATLRYETFVPWSPPRVEGLYLESAATIEGTVVLTGETVPRVLPSGSVEVLYWRNDRPTECLSQSLNDESGRFTIEDAPPGLVHLLALVEGIGLGELASVELTAGQTGHVTLEVPAALTTVKGRVISEASGRPLAGGRVSVALPQGVPENAVVKPLPAVTCGAEGDFELRTSPSVGMTLVVTAEGHSTRTLDLSSEGSNVDLGTILLSLARPLTVRLVSPGRLPGFEYRLSSEDGRFPELAFDEDGSAVVADYPFLDASLRVDQPDTNPIFVQAHLDAERIIEVPVDGLRSVLVNFDLEAAPDPDRELVLVITHACGDGIELRRARFLKDLTPVRIEGIPGTPVTATLRHTGGPALGTASGQFMQGQQEIQITIRTSGIPTSFRIVTKDGSPVVGATLHVVIPGSAAVGVTAITDGTGTCTVLLPAGELSGMLIHPRALRTCIPIVAAEELRVLEIEPTGSLELVTELDGLPLADATCSLADPIAHRLVVDSTHADGDGRFLWNNLHEGRYVVQVRHPEIDSIDHEVTVGPGEARSLVLRATRR